jgi:hypothetical protein
VPRRVSGALGFGVPSRHDGREGRIGSKGWRLRVGVGVVVAAEVVLLGFDAGWLLLGPTERFEIEWFCLFADSTGAADAYFSRFV